MIQLLITSKLELKPYDALRMRVERFALCGQFLERIDLLRQNLNSNASRGSSVFRNLVRMFKQGNICDHCQLVQAYFINLYRGNRTVIAIGVGNSPQPKGFG